MKLKHFSLLFSLAGILVLYFLSSLSQPPLIGIREMPSYEGKQVLLEGVVIEHHLTDYGSQILKIENANATTSVFVEGVTDVEFGDKIQVTGEVQKYKGDWELAVNDVHLVRILTKGGNISIPLRQLADDPARYLNLNINITGYVDSISNSCFYVTDIEGNYSLPIFYELEKNITLSPGKKISAYGRFSFDEENFRYKLEINEEIHSITLVEG